MAIDPQVPSSQGFINAALAAISLLSSSLGGVFFWLLRRHVNRVDKIETALSELAPLEQLIALELRVSETVSRKELVAYLTQLRNDSLQRENRMREDRLMMHRENQDRFKEMRDNLDSIRSDVREDLGELNRRINVNQK